MIAFDKLDGSNIRVKWTNKKGFNLYGTRTQLLDRSHSSLGLVVDIFSSKYAQNLERIFQKEFMGEKEIVIFGEYYGPNSFAGLHFDPPELMDFYLFDIMLIKKSYTEFILPQHFLKMVPKFDAIGLKTPKVVYEGNLTDDFIRRVRENEFNLNEGVVCKGTSKLGSFRGKMWMCKIKTNAYLEKLKSRYGKDYEQYWE